MGKPKRVPGMGLSDSKYFESSKGYSYDDNEDFERLEEGYSRVAHQDAPNPVAYTQSKKQLRGGGFELGEKKYIYEKVKPQQESDPVEPEVAPEPDPQPVPKTDENIEYSPEIQQAKERVKTYQDEITSGDTTQAIFNDPQKKAVDSFLNYKKLELGKGLNLQ